jgi:hypothetical protein
MPPINESDRARQTALALSEHFGRLAATAPAIRRQARFQRSDVAVPPGLAAVIGRLRQRAGLREHAGHKLRVNEFMAP